MQFFRAWLCMLTYKDKSYLVRRNHGFIIRKNYGTLNKFLYVIQIQKFGHRTINVNFSRNLNWQKIVPLLIPMQTKIYLIEINLKVRPIHVAYYIEGKTIPNYQTPSLYKLIRRQLLSVALCNVRLNVLINTNLSRYTAFLQYLQLEIFIVFLLSF